MKACGIAAIDHAPQVVAEWLDQLQEEVGWVDRTKVYVLLRETLRALRDFLTVDEATDLAAHLPLLIRAIYLEGWVPTRRPGHLRDVEIFLQRVHRPFLRDTPMVIPEVAAQAVMQVLGRQISLSELNQLGVVMRHSLQELRV